MQKRLLSLVLFLFVLQIGRAQFVNPYKFIDTAYYYRIYLLDGSFLKAKIKKQEENHILLKLENGETLEVDYDVIGAKVFLRKGQQLLPKGKMIYTEGAYNAIALNFLIGENDEFFGKNGLSVNASLAFGKRINDRLGLGLGLGFTKKAYFLAPVFLDIRGAAWQRGVSPVYNFQIGYAFPFFQTSFKEHVVFLKRKGGLYFQPSVGLRFASRGQTNSVISAGFNLMKGYYEYEYSYSSNSQTGNIYIVDAFYKNLIFKYELIF